MPASAPITQDVVTISRKLPETDRINLVGLTRVQLRETLIENGTPENTSPASMFTTARCTPSGPWPETISSRNEWS